MCGIRTRSGNPSAAETLEWLATRQAGHVARRQLLAAGVSRDAIGRRVRNGTLLREHPGVYLVAHRAPSEWAREFAAALACGPGSLVSHRSAARVQGLLSYPAFGQVWVTTTAERGANLRGVRTTQTSVLEPADVTFVGWLPLTSPARTLLDLAAVEDLEALEGAVAAAQVGRLVREVDLWEQVARNNGRRGTRALRSVLERHVKPANVKSKAEGLMLRLIRRAGLPEPEVNVSLGRWRPDFLWREQRVVAEFDSYAFHTDIDSFRRDREKSNELQLRGFLVLRFTWHELTRTPGILAARLRQALAV